MARRQRRRSNSGIHHVMNRGVNRRDVFFGDGDRIEFGRRLADLHERFDVATLAYCLMPNHYHLLVWAPDDRLSAAMQHLGTTYTARVNARHGRDGPLFRGRFHSIPVETDLYLGWAARYIHLNPLALGGVSDPAAFRWSSYRTYLGLRAAPSFLRVDVVSELFHGDRDRLRIYTESDQRFEICAPADLDQLIALEIGLDALGHDDGSGSGWLTRSIALLVMDRLRGHPLSEAIEQRLGFPNRAAQEKALRRARARLDRDPATRRVLAAVLEQVGAARAA